MIKELHFLNTNPGSAGPLSSTVHSCVKHMAETVPDLTLGWVWANCLHCFDSKSQLCHVKNTINSKVSSKTVNSETVYCYCFWKIEQLGLHNEARIACSMSAPQQILSMQCMYSMISGVKLPLLTFLCRWLFNAVFLASGKAEHDIIRCPLTTFLRQKLWTQVTRTNKVVLDQ